MDGLHDITGGEAVIRLGGRPLRLPPFRLRHWGALERHYLRRLPDPVAVAAKIAASAPREAAEAALLRAYEDATRLPMADFHELTAWTLSPQGMPQTLAVLLRDDYADATLDWCREQLDALDVNGFVELRKAVEEVMNGSVPKSAGSPTETAATPD